MLKKIHSSSIFIGVVIAIAFLFGFVLSFPQKSITSFAQCRNAGYPILQTYPAQCQIPNGKSFTEISSTNARCSGGKCRPYLCLDTGKACVHPKNVEKNL